MKSKAKLLGNWNTLNGHLMKLSEKEVSALLEHEKKNDNRITFVLRLHSRLNKLRRERERRALTKKLLDKPNRRAIERKEAHEARKWK